MVSDQSRAFRQGVFGKSIQVEVGIRCQEIEFVAVCDPISIPTQIPALNQNTIETMLCREIDISTCVCRGCAMLRTRSPSRLVEVHLPPDSDILARRDPTRIVELVGLV